MGPVRRSRATVDSVAMNVAVAVAAHADEDVLDLPLLHGAIDPDALDRLITSMAAGSVTFPFAGYEVTVDSNGAIDISDTATG